MERTNLVGVMLDEKDVLLTNRLFACDGGTSLRPFDQFSEFEAEEYARLRVGKTLFSKNSFSEFKQYIEKNEHKDDYNETLIRLRWNCDGTSKIFIHSDDLESRLLAKQYAETLQIALQKAGKANLDYRIPICFYTPDKPDLMFREYTETEYMLDCLEAKHINSEPSLKKEKLANKHYEFLFALAPHEINKELETIVDGLPLAIQLLKKGYVHTYNFLVKKSNFNLEKVLNDNPINFKEKHSLLNSILKSIIQNEDKQLLKYFIEKMDWSSFSKDSKFSFLPLAANKQLIPQIEPLISGNLMNLKAVDENRKTALEIAAENGDIDAIRILVKNISKTTENNSQIAAFGQAVENNHQDIVKLFLEYNVNLDAVYKDDETAVFIAAKNGYFETVNLLIENDADFEIANKFNQTPLWIAAKMGHLKILDLLIENDADVNAPNDSGSTPLYIATYNGHFDSVKLLLECGAKANMVNHHNVSALWVAAKNGRLDLVKLLVAKGANLELSTHHASTAFFAAASNGHIDVIKYLHSVGAKMDVSLPSGDTPVSIAKKNGHHEVAKFILEAISKTTQVDDNYYGCNLF